MVRLTPAKYEEFVQKVIEELFGVSVLHQHVFVGRVSQREIRVDLAFTLSVGGVDFFVIVECKRYNSTVTVDDVEEFHSKLDDLGAHKGIMVTTVGYQSGAVKTAKGRGIALALLSPDRQPGEIEYILNSAAPFSLPTPVANDRLFQGNIRGLYSDFEHGFRFNDFSRIYALLILELSRTQAG